MIDVIMNGRSNLHCFLLILELTLGELVAIVSRVNYLIRCRLGQPLLSETHSHVTLWRQLRHVKRAMSIFRYFINLLLIMLCEAV
jgi:hypothetical protein